MEPAESAQKDFAVFVSDFHLTDADVNEINSNEKFKIFLLDSIRGIHQYQNKLSVWRNRYSLTKHTIHFVRRYGGISNFLRNEHCGIYDISQALTDKLLSARPSQTDIDQGLAPMHWQNRIISRNVCAHQFGRQPIPVPMPERILSIRDRGVTVIGKAIFATLIMGFCLLLCCLPMGIWYVGYTEWTLCVGRVDWVSAIAPTIGFLLLTVFTWGVPALWLTGVISTLRETLSDVTAAGAGTYSSPRYI